MLATGSTTGVFCYFAFTKICLVRDLHASQSAESQSQRERVKQRTRYFIGEKGNFCQDFFFWQCVCVCGSGEPFETEKRCNQYEYVVHTRCLRPGVSIVALPPPSLFFSRPRTSHKTPCLPNRQRKRDMEESRQRDEL